MNRTRVSTTVDGELMEHARRLRDWPNVATMMDAALTTLVAAHREGEIDAAYEAYDRYPIDEPDAWGSLASFHIANLRHRAETGRGRSPVSDDPESS